MNKISYSIPEAVRITSLGRSTIYEAMKNGQLKARKCGKRTVILECDLSAFLKALPPLEVGKAA
jgi:excisionase family DNA binding protein